jgi:tetratricopeptide (TPR) repeat protein
MEDKEVLEHFQQLCAAREWGKVLSMAESRLYDNPNDEMGLFYSSIALREQNHSELAYIIQNICTQMYPWREENWNNLGQCADAIWRYEEAYACYQKVLDMNPMEADAFASLASACVGLGRIDEALECANQALAIDPENSLAIINKAFALFHKKKWKEAWQCYDHLLGHPSKRRKFIVYGKKQRWDGDPKDTVVVYTEQGIGDGIMFASCIPDMKCKQVIIDCDKKLEGLFARSFPKAEVHGTRMEEAPNWMGPHIDSSIAIGSLPMMYRNSEADFPRTTYLKADPARKVMFRALLDKLPGLKVGISWYGGNRLGGIRQLELDRLQELIDTTPGVSWVNLNYKDTPCPDGVYTFPFATMTNDYDDTAALVDELDLVISVPQAVVHLAGGLGKDTLCLVPDVHRWIYSGDQHSWYGSVKLLHGWDTVIDQVKTEIEKRATVEPIRAVC